MRFSIWPSPASPWSETLATVQHAEATGWDGAWYADHFMPNAADNSGPTSECWTTLAALAVAVPRIRIGPLVTGNTYRHPAVLAKMAANVQEISGGRLVLGLGAGWQENEHAAYGIEFSTIGGRLGRLEEACAAIKGLLESERTNLAGRYYTLTDAPLAPKPPAPIPLLIGGGGEKRTLRIAAKYADEWNVWGTPALLRQKQEVLDQHCESLGRDPKAIQRSCQAMLTITDDEELVKRISAGGRPVIAGNVARVREIIAEYRDAGLNEIIIPDWNLGPRERRFATMDQFIKEVAPAFR
ncbi:MAG TPA: TIGR03560 family F420-dependent LLM class oxidoreductase [Tepidiformaceae bacterium]|nr:TIGR03560 family F420-dependent LLM class oxidoreductase [Tepidiformaceae bacterium]